MVRGSQRTRSSARHATGRSLVVARLDCPPEVRPRADRATSPCRSARLQRRLQRPFRATRLDGQSRGPWQRAQARVRGRAAGCCSTRGRSERRGRLGGRPECRGRPHGRAASVFCQRNPRQRLSRPDCSAPCLEPRTSHWPTPAPASTRARPTPAAGLRAPAWGDWGRRPWQRPKSCTSERVSSAPMGSGGRGVGTGTCRRCPAPRTRRLRTAGHPSTRSG